MTVTGAREEARADEQRTGDGGESAEPVAPPRRRRLARSVVARTKSCDLDTWVLLVGCGIAIGVSIWLTWGIWEPGVPFGDDNAAHVARTDFAISNVFSRWQPDGWDPTFGLGYQEFLFVGPAFQLLAFALKLLSLGTLSNLAAFKLAVVVSYAALPPAVAFLAWAFGLGKRAAGFAAILSLALSTPLGGAGLQGVFETGLVTNQLGSVLMTVALGALVLVLRRPTPGRIVLTGVMVALVVVSHILSAIILAILVLALLATASVEWLFLHRSPPRPPDEGGERWWRPRRADARSERVWPRLKALALAALLAAGLSGFVFVPLLVHGNLRGVSTAFPDVGLSVRFGEIWRGDFLVRPYVAAVIAAGLVFELFYACRYRKMALTLLYTPIVFLLIARLFLRMLPGNIVAMQLTNRSWAYVGILAILPLAHFLSWVTGGAARLCARIGGTRVPALAVASAGIASAVPLALSFVLVLVPPELNREQVRAVRPTPAAADAARVLEQVVPPGARFATQRIPSKELAITGMTHPDFWLAAASGKPTLNIWNPESSSVYGPVFEPERMTTEPPSGEAEKLARYGVTHVVILDAPAATNLVSSGRFNKIWGRDALSIYEILPVAGQPPPASLMTTIAPATAKVTANGTDSLTFDVDATRATSATIAVAWSPKWRVEVNGERVPTDLSGERLIAVPVPAGKSTIELRYGTDVWDWLGRFLTLAALVTLLFFRQPPTPVIGQ